MNIFRPLLIVCLPAIAPPTAQAEHLVVVQLVDGPARVAAIDRRTDGRFLWLRSTGRVTTLLRPVAWQRVAAIAPFVPVAAEKPPAPNRPPPPDLAGRYRSIYAAP